MIDNIIQAMEKCIGNAVYYLKADYADVIKLREIEYRMGIWYAYGKVLEELDKDKYWDMQQKYLNDVKECEGRCRKIVRDIKEK